MADNKKKEKTLEDILTMKHIVNKTVPQSGDINWVTDSNRFGGGGSTFEERATGTKSGQTNETKRQ